MDIDCDEFGGSLAAWGTKKGCDYRKVEWGFGNLGGFGEDDFLNRMSFYGNQILYETVNWVGNGSVMMGNSLFNDVFKSSLPEDPFSMNTRSTLNTVSDWFHEDLVSESYYEPIGVDPTLFESLDCFSNGNQAWCEVALPEDPFCMEVRSTLHTISDFLTDSHDEPIGVLDQILLGGSNRFRNPTRMISQQQISSSNDRGEACEPHDAFELVLPYLQMQDILAVEMVCRSLRDSVRKEPFFWTTIDLDNSPLKYKVTDDSLFKLTRRAQGKLQCLNLGGCVGITDNGLMRVLDTNPCLTKLSVSGCLRLSTEGMLSTLRDLKSSNRLAVKSLITGGALYFTEEQFEELNLLLGAGGKASSLKSRKQRFYTSRRSKFCLEEDRVTDLEICPWCEKPSLVFDCPVETCPFKDHPCPKLSCRACIVCIERCHDCGSCLNDCEYKLFCFAFNCVVCYEKSRNQLLEFL